MRFTAFTKLRHVCVAVLLLVPQTAFAQSPGEIAQKWGLLGTWAEFCNRPPARENDYATFVRRDGELFLDRDFGDGGDSNRVAAASILPDGMISVSIVFRGLKQTRINVFALGPDGRRRAMFNSDTQGTFSVKDGILLGSGNPTSWLTRCR
jgi:hypothetical protein